MEDESLQFGRVLGGAGGRSAWFTIIPVLVVALGLIGYSVYSYGKVEALRSDLASLKRQMGDLQGQLAEKDRALTAARADDDVLRAPGEAVAMLSSEKGGEGAPSGVAIVHPTEHALRVYAYGLAAAPPGEEYQVWVRGENTRLLGKLERREGGAASGIFRDVPVGKKDTVVVMFEKSSDSGRTPLGQEVLAGSMPEPGQHGVMAAPAPREDAKRGKGESHHGKKRR